MTNGGKQNISGSFIIRECSHMTSAVKGGKGFPMVTLLLILPVKGHILLKEGEEGRK